MYRVMLADDEPMILQGLAETIPWDDYGLELAGTALNGADAWAYMQAHAVDILITDIRMPRLDGLALLGRIRDAGLPVKCIVLSGYSDFEYVKESARLGIENYLVKPINLEECRTTLEETVYKLDLEQRNHLLLTHGQATLFENTIQRWMFGTIHDRELLEHGELLGLRLTGGFRAAVLHWTGSDLDADAAATMKIIDLCREQIDLKSLGYSIPQPFCRIFLLFHAGDRESSLRSVSAILEGIAAAAYDEHGVRAMAAIGNYQERFQGVGISMRNANSMVDYRYLRPEKNVFVYEDYLQSKEQFPQFMSRFLEQLQELLTTKLNRQEILALIESVAAQVTDDSILSETYLYSMCILTVMQITQAVLSFQPTAAARLQVHRETIADIYGMHAFDEILGWMTAKINDILDVADFVRGDYSKTVARILAYVDQSYSREINMKTIAAEFEMSSLYLGQLFRTEVGESFTEYLNKYRIEQAKRLLKQNISAKETALRVGYSNWHYFFTVFKKYVGVSPSEMKSALPDQAV